MKIFNKEPSEKKVKFKKPKKELVEVKPKKISQRTANRLLFGFVAGTVFLSGVTVVSNSMRSMADNKPVVQSKVKDSRNISNKVGLFMTDYLNSYFSDSSAEDRQKLQSFYGAGIDVKSDLISNLPSHLTGATLIEITDNLATYRVSYQVKVGEEWKDNVGVINIPYQAKSNKYYVSDLPYFTDEDSYVAEGVTEEYRLVSQSEDKKFDKVKEYVEAFFKAYTSGDNTQMSPFSKEIKPVMGYVLTSIDYHYFIEEKEQIVDVVQVTFTDGLGLAHQENFVLTLRADQSGDTYYVEKMEHGISNKVKEKMK